MVSFIVFWQMSLIVKYIIKRKTERELLLDITDRGYKFNESESSKLERIISGKDFSDYELQYYFFDIFMYIICPAIPALRQNIYYNKNISNVMINLENYNCIIPLTEDEKRFYKKNHTYTSAVMLNASEDLEKRYVNSINRINSIKRVKKINKKINNLDKQNRVMICSTASGIYNNQEYAIEYCVLDNQELVILSSEGIAEELDMDIQKNLVYKSVKEGYTEIKEKCDDLDNYFSYLKEFEGVSGEKNNEIDTKKLNAKAETLNFYIEWLSKVSNEFNNEEDKKEDIKIYKKKK